MKIEIVCVKIPENNSELFELGKKYKSYYITGLEDQKGFWVVSVFDSSKVIKQYGLWMNEEDFITLDQWREQQLKQLGIL